MTFFGWKKRCRQLEVEKVKLQERNAWLEARVVELEAKNTQLVQALAAATKNSRNSSKRPSGDIVKPPAKGPGKGKRRKIGGQRGHPKHERAAFCAEQIDHQIVHQLQRCPVDPSHPLVEVPGQEKTFQQVELVEKPFVVTEHVAKAYWCARCQQVHYAALPAAVGRGGLCGPRLTGWVSYFKGKMHAS